MLKTKPNYNFTKLQRQVIRELRNMNNIVIIDADKNLGITVFRREDYIKSILAEHLLQNEIYSQLSGIQAQIKQKEVETKLREPVTKYNQELTLTDKRFFLRNFQLKHSIPTFYGMPKLHKKKTGNYYKKKRL